MLIKVNHHRINLTHVIRVEEGNAGVYVYFMNQAEGLWFSGEMGESILAAWDKQAQFQSDMQEVNEAAIAQTLAQIRPEKQSPILKPGLLVKR